MTPAIFSPPSMITQVWRGFGLVLRLRRYRGGMSALVLISIIAIATLVGPEIYGRSPLKQDYNSLLASPGWRYPLGTDELGRDQLARVLAGARVTVRVSVLSVLVAAPLGAVIGIAAGYWRGWARVIISVLLDAMLAFPVIVLALAITAARGPGPNTLILAFAVVQTPIFARIARGEAISLRERAFVEAARATGASDLRIMLRHVLLNMLGPLIVQGSLALSFVILGEAALSFLGVGVQPPQAAWGSMLRRGLPYLHQQPGMVLVPGAAIFFCVLGLNFLGDALREAVDPNVRSTGKASKSE